MVHADDRDELRELQRKAYGRDGGLTDAEARRLREIEQRPPAITPALKPVREDVLIETVPSFAAGFPRSGFADTNAFEDLFRDDEAPSPAREEEAPEPDAPAQQHSSRRLNAALAAFRRHGLIAAAASVLLVAIGIGVGWIAFGQTSDDVALTGEQQQRRLDLYEKDPYDEGSLRAVGQDDDVLVWYGTQNDGADACLVIDVAGQSAQQCQPRADVDPFSLSASVTAMTRADAESDFLEPVNVNAYRLFSSNDEPMVSIQRWTRTGANLRGFSGEDRDRAQELLAEDESAYLRIIGSFRDQPVWLIDTLVEDVSEICLVVDADEGRKECVPAEVASESGISMLAFVDDGDGGSEVWGLQVAYTPDQTPYLVLTHEAASEQETGGETYQEYGERFGLDDGQGTQDEQDAPST